VRRGAVRCGVPGAGFAAANLVGQAAPPGGQAQPRSGGHVTAIAIESGVEDYRSLLDRVFDERVTAWTAEAQASERFPRKLIEYLGQSGVFTAKWGDRQQPDVSKVIELALALGRLGSAGIAVGVSLHDSAIAILRRFGKSDHLRTICEQAIAARPCCASEHRRSPEDLTCRSSRPKYARRATDSRFAASRSSCRCPRSPTTSWWWPAASTTIPPAGTATWS
jgi:hypothetical protein